MFVRNGSIPGRMPDIYLEMIKTGEELISIDLNTPQSPYY